MTKSIALAVALAAGLVLSASTAHAQVYPTCSYTQPYFTNATPYDVVAYPTANSQGIFRTIMNDTGQQFGHVAAFAGYGGTTLTEDTWDTNQYPSQGGCACPIDVNSLRNLQPGVSYHSAYGNNVYLLKGASSYGGCYYTSSAYKIHALTSNIGVGTCASYLTNQCGVSYLGGSNVAVNNAAVDVYWWVRNYVSSQVGWFTSLVCGGVSSDQMGDRAAKQVMNELFFGWGDQNLTFYPNYIQYPDPASYAASAWPQYVSPGPSPDGIYYSQYYSGRQIMTGQSASATYTCSCPSGYTYNTSTGACDPPANSCQYACSTYGFAPGQCSGGWYCDGSCINYNGCTASGGGGGAVCGNGTCESGENGSSCGQDCCDYYTSCDQTRQNQGSQWCRNTNGAGYAWTGQLVCGSSVGYGSTSVCGGGTTWNCCSDTNNWTTNACAGGGGGGGSCDYYRCADYGWYAGECTGGWYCDGTCISPNNACY